MTLLNNATFAFLTCFAASNAFADTQIYSQDLRPVDGALKELTISPNESNGSDLTLVSSYVSRQNGKEIVVEDVIGFAMKCNARKLVLTCSKDDRPVDGTFVSVSFEKKNKAYVVTETIKFYDRINGKEVIEKNTIMTKGTLEVIKN